ncbi:phospholipase-like protein [Tanacetum coccineum]
MEYPAKIHIRSKLHYFPLIKDRLNEARRSLFRTTCFRYWLDITYVENDDGMIHYVLQKQCCADDDSFDLPLIYNVNGHNLHFGRCEFCLVTGFKFGMVSFREYRNGDIPFRNRLFPEKIETDVKTIDVLALIEDEEKFSKVSDEDAIRLCLLLSLEVIFMGRELVSVVDDVLLRMVDNLDAWNTFPWGEHIWRQLYDSIRNAPIELAPMKAEFQSNWYTHSYDFFMWYAPRSPHVSIGGLYGEYLNKTLAARAAKQKDSGEFHPGLRGRQKGREDALIDRVQDLEDLCESLLTLPKEVKSLRGRIFKLESIIQVITLKTNRDEKEESLNKFGLQIEDLLKSTSKDEPDIKDNTSKIVEKDVGDVYCCDVNGHVPGVFMSANPVSQPIYGDFSSDLAVLNGFCNLSQNEDEKGDYERQQDDISKMTEEAEQKIEFEIQRLYDHREARLNKIAEEEKQRKLIGHMNSSSHMKLAIERCVQKKRKYVDEWLSRSVVGRCKFPWCNDISVDRSFWHGLCGLDDNRKGWLVDEVFIPINEPKRHWSLAMFHICSGIVTFYDSEKTIATYEKELRPWYLKMRQCLEEKIRMVLKETGVFEKKIIDPTKYKISFRHADHVSKQGRVFGDCGVFLCIFLYRLAYCIPLVVDDPVQAALAYREKMIRFYFQHKMFCP